MKKALITGGSRGIGKASVGEFLNNGYEVITTSTTGKLPYKADRVSCFKFELKNAEASKLELFLKKENTKLELLINNAWQLFDTSGQLKPKELKQSLNVNVAGTIEFTLSMLPFLKENGVIIFISSEYGSLSDDWGNVKPSYRIAKAALNMFVRNLYKDTRIIEKKIKVYAFDPGWVKTDMGGKNADRDPGEPAKELLELAKSNNKSGLFYRGLKQRDW